MILATGSVSFKQYFWSEFFSKLNKKLNEENSMSSGLEILSNLMSWLVSDQDPMASIEELATVENSSEVTIFLSDLLEKIDLLESSELMSILDGQVEDLKELFILLSEEEAFLESIKSFIDTKDLQQGESTNAIPVAEVSDIEVESSGEKLSFNEAIFTFCTETFTDNTQVKTLLDDLVNNDSHREEYRNLLLPSEIQNIITILNDINAYDKVDIVSSLELINSNIQKIPEDFWEEFEKSGYSIVKAFSQNEAPTMPSFKDVKKIVKKSDKKIDPLVKEKLKKYFFNDIKDNLNEIKEGFLGISEHEEITKNLPKISNITIAIRDMASIHGYEALEIIAIELEKLLTEAANERLVVTDESHILISKIHDTIMELIGKLETDDEKLLVNEIFKLFNELNESFALVEYSDDSALINFSSDSSEVLDAFWVSNKTFVENKNWDHLRANFHLYGLKDHIEYLDKTIASGENPDTEILLNPVLDKKTDEKKSKKTEEKTLLNSQKFSFEEIVERTGVYEPILYKKLKQIKKLLNDQDFEKFIHLSNGIAVETNWLTYDNLSDFFNFVNLNFDEILSTKKGQFIHDEIDLIRKDYIHYEFNVERFSPQENEEETAENSLEEDDWIDGVANVIENESVDLDIEITNLKFDDVHSIDSDIREIFNDEAEEYLEQLSKQIERLRENSSDSDATLIAEKSASTLKGAAKMLNLNSIGEIASKIERAFETSKFTNKEVLEENLDKIEKLLNIIKDILSGDIAADEAIEKSDTVSEIINPETDQEMLDIFQEESKANIEGIEDAINILYSDIENRNAVKRIEADALSLKSAAKMLGFKNIGMLSECIENCAESILSDKFDMSVQIIDALNNVTAVIKKIRLGQEVDVLIVQQAADTLEKSLNQHQENEKKSEELSAIIEDDIDEFKELFLEESSQIIDDFSSQIQELTTADSQDLKDKLLNNIYTVKGSASMVQLDVIKEFVTAFEDLIEGYSLTEPAIYDLANRFIEELKLACKRLKSNENEGSDDMDRIIHDLKSLSLTGISDKNDSPEPEEEVTLDLDEPNLEEDQEDNVIPEEKNQIEEEFENSAAESETNNNSNYVQSDSIIVADEVKQLKSIAFSLINKRIELNKKSNDLKRIIDQESDNEHLRESFASFANSSDELSSLIKNLTSSLSKNLIEKENQKKSKIDAIAIESGNEAYLINKKFIKENISFESNNYNNDKLLYRHGDDYIPALAFEKNILGLLTENKFSSVIILSMQSKDIALLISNKVEDVKFEVNENEDNVDELFSYLSVNTDGKLSLLLNLHKLALFDVNVEPVMEKTKNIKIKKEDGTSIQVLVVDDSISIRKFVGNIIESMGYKSILANDGADAVNKMNKNKIDIIITDIEMPNVDGLELIKTIRGIEEYKGIPILVLVGRTAVNKIDEAISFGASSSIAKPFKELELKGKLSEIIEE